ncbi:hypothetical protein [Pseudalkalibacillus salsuginis]|uniref:hypothetical protein n=1 Tax=Pseudalkalibacillus salsuginis TaxID=2910972 RepID=UPI001F2F5DE7|nr:hypothetical protein [Pseudalkalibacillus salsuginis]MCF6412042.1 hypothetical protein [Pseudalkalibacillus salsuginis]
MPKGVLIISDTRETDLKGNITSDQKRKIVNIAPFCYLATAGSESTFYAARILRNCLYNKSSIESINKNVLELYKKVNGIYKEVNYHPVGPIMLAQYNNSSEKFKLFHIDPQVNDYECLTEATYLTSIGANPFIRQNIETKIKKLIAGLNKNINSDSIHEIIAKNVHHYYKRLSIPTIGKNIFVVYLTTNGGKPASANFFVNQQDQLFNIDKSQNSEFITFKNKSN